MAKPKELSLLQALKQAVPNWDPAKHPRDRDGQFIEVGEWVHAFQSKSSEKPFVTGMVKASHFAPDGRMFIAIDDGTGGNLHWVRPKQIERIKKKADLKLGQNPPTPMIPLPAVSEMESSIYWLDDPSGLLNMVDDVYSAGTKGELTDVGEVVAHTLDDEQKEFIGIAQGTPTPSIVPQADEVKIPAGKTPADILALIKTSYYNKGNGPYDHFDEGFDAAFDDMLADPDQESATKKLAKLMTAAKLGGKQRKRYQSVLGQHLGGKQAVEVVPEEEAKPNPEETLKQLAKGVDTSDIQDLLDKPVPTANPDQVNDWVEQLDSIWEEYGEDSDEYKVSIDQLNNQTDEQAKVDAAQALYIHQQQLIATQEAMNESGAGPDGYEWEQALLAQEDDDYDPPKINYPKKKAEAAKKASESLVNQLANAGVVTKPNPVPQKLLDYVENHSIQIAESKTHPGYYWLTYSDGSGGIYDANTAPIYDDSVPSPSADPDAWTELGHTVYDPDTDVTTWHPAGGGEIDTASIPKLPLEVLQHVSMDDEVLVDSTNDTGETYYLLQDKAGWSTIVDEYGNIYEPEVIGDVEWHPHGVIQKGHKFFPSAPPPAAQYDPIPAVTDTVPPKVLEEMNANPGSKLYQHAQYGSFIVVRPDGKLYKFKLNGQKTTSTSATAEKLAAGHGGWKLVAGDAGAPVSNAPDLPGSLGVMMKSAPPGTTLMMSPNGTSYYVVLPDGYGPSKVYVAESGDYSFDEGSIEPGPLVETLTNYGYDKVYTVPGASAPAAPAAINGWAPITPSSGGTNTPAGVTGPSQANALVAPNVSPQQAKKQIQLAIADRIKDKVTPQQMVAAYNDTSYAHNIEVKLLAETYQSYVIEGKPLPKGAAIHRNEGGNWLYTSASQGPAWTTDKIVDPTPEQFEEAIRETMVNGFIQLWAQTSNDSNPRSLAMQLAANDEFGLVDTYGWSDSAQSAALEYSKHGALFRAFLREMYDNTQAWAKANNIKKVRLKRGVKAKVGTVGSTAHVKFRPMSSFSSNLNTAQSFSGGGSGKIMEIEVPIEWVIGTAATGFGCKSEFEWVVLGGIHHVRVIK